MKSITLMIIKLLKFMKIDKSKLIEVIQKIFKTKKIKKIDHLKLGSLKRWDSLGNFNFLLEIEKEFNIKLSNEDFTNINSIKDLKKTLKKY
tara:strand:- start:3032 stop:3304 length:273 start_codon:yes stop_codon:yes gene_type:complete